LSPLLELALVSEKNILVVFLELERLLLVPPVGKVELQTLKGPY
jgi:hypothetical protein